MPVTVEHLDALTDQDRADLDKLAAESDHGRWGEEPSALRFGGRFNSRLLALAVLLPEGEHWRLQRLAVRELTRRRGVARRMVEAIELRAREAGARGLAAPAPRGEQEEFALVSLGFRPAGDHWQRP